jgi:hypothetical protein
LRIKSRKNLSGIEISDSIPRMTKLFNKFGRKPDRIDENTRKVFWDIAKLNPGEERVFSYIIY